MGQHAATLELVVNTDPGEAERLGERATYHSANQSSLTSSLGQHPSGSALILIDRFALGGARRREDPLLTS